MNNKIKIGFIAVSFFISVSAFAKQNQDIKQIITADTIVAKMKVQLRLTDEQALEVKPIIEDYLEREKQLFIDEKKELSKVLTGDQMFTWNFLQNEPSHDKKKHSKL